MKFKEQKIPALPVLASAEAAPSSDQERSFKSSSDGECDSSLMISWKFHFSHVNIIS